jgi:hypothetical protein
MGKAGTALLYHSCNGPRSGGHRAAMRGADDRDMTTAPLAPYLEPYGEVALGVECAWPLPLAARAQYTVSTGTPKM